MGKKGVVVVPNSTGNEGVGRPSGQAEKKTGSV